MLLNGVFKNVLIISPHADDEVIGCGGLIKKVINYGGKVHVAVTAVGDITFYHLGRVVTKEERKLELKSALERLGVTSHHTIFEDYESLMDTIPIRKVISAFEQLIGSIQPSAVLLPYPSFHQDHKVVFDAGFAALRPTPKHNTHLRLIATYEYPFKSWSNENSYSGNFYINIADEMNDKIEALKCHQSQLREGRHLISPESVKLWAEKRGLEANMPYAEMFHIIRLLV